MNTILTEAKELQKELTEYRQSLHRNAECGFDLQNTVNFVENTLKTMGFTPKRCGKAGIIADMGAGNPKNCVLLRADMDALPIKENSGERFSCKTGNMHACGHDLHTAMLLGAAKLLKPFEKEIHGRIRLLFQPAEEVLEGAKNVIKHGALENPEPNAAIMLHVMTNTELPTGVAVISSAGVSAPAADFFTIELKGKGCHGSTPWEGINPLPAAAQIVTALSALSAQEIPVANGGVLSIGRVHGGSVGNVIPQTASISGTVRTFDETEREFLKKRIRETVSGIAKAYRLQGKTAFTSGCPTLINDGELSALAAQSLKDLLGKNRAFTVQELQGNTSTKRSGGSEDFAYISQLVPSVMVALAAGEKAKGYAYPLHHPKVRFDEGALPIGAAIYAQLALAVLKQ